MDTMQRVQELMDERSLSLFQLSELCGISYSTLRSTQRRNGQLSVDTIEQICAGLRMPMSRFFAGPDETGTRGRQI